MSSIAKFVKDRIAELPVDEVFTYDSFGQTALVERRAVAKALSRLVKSGEVEVLCRGQFYKPAKCKYGSLGLAEEKQIRSLLRGGYVSGAEAFNRIGLTTQVPSVIEIAYPGVPYRKKWDPLKSSIYGPASTRCRKTQSYWYSLMRSRKSEKYKMHRQSA